MEVPIYKQARAMMGGGTPNPRMLRLSSSEGVCMRAPNPDFVTKT